MRPAFPQVPQPVLMSAKPETPLSVLSAVAREISPEDVPRAEPLRRSIEPPDADAPSPAAIVPSPPRVAAPAATLTQPPLFLRSSSSAAVMPAVTLMPPPIPERP